MGYGFEINMEYGFETSTKKDLSCIHLYMINTGELAKVFNPPFQCQHPAATIKV